VGFEGSQGVEIGSEKRPGWECSTVRGSGRVGQTQLLVKFSDEVGSWKKFRNGKNDFGSLVSEVGALGLLDTFKLEGPFELRVGGDDKLSLLLPVWNFIQFSA
jgi:hypothetical protein